ncbi:MAG: ParB N-terminal domain-containing protein [Bdellovibrionaceae bacterium]|nr:ParB N-terminal domain-containing protein [Pseudobdellovibrionaceae bacterium]
MKMSKNEMQSILAHGNGITTTVAIEKINISKDFTLRDVDLEHVDVLFEVLNDKDELPPIKVTPRFEIIDGRHRYEAHLKAERETIKVQILEHDNFEFKYLNAIHANTLNGLSMTLTQKKNALRSFLEKATSVPSDRALARVFGLSPTTVGSINPKKVRPIKSTSSVPPKKKDDVPKSEELPQISVQNGQILSKEDESRSLAVNSETNAIGLTSVQDGQTTAEEKEVSDKPQKRNIVRSTDNDHPAIRFEGSVVYSHFANTDILLTGIESFRIIVSESGELLGELISKDGATRKYSLEEVCS